MTGVGGDLVILAGGMASRMGPVCANTPKALLPVMGRSFILWQVDEIRRAWPSLSRIHCVIRTSDAAFFESLRSQLPVSLSLMLEETPLGTGGAILQAAKQSGISDCFLVMNGDVLFTATPQFLIDAATEYGAAIQCIAVEDTARFGTITVDADRVKTFGRDADNAGLINAGLYAFTKKILNRFEMRACSFERDIAPHLIAAGQVGAVETSGSFIDIGTPGSYAKADKFMIENGFISSAVSLQRIAV